MNETEYSEAAVEVFDILNHTKKEDVQKIPQSEGTPPRWV